MLAAQLNDELFSGSAIRLKSATLLLDMKTIPKKKIQEIWTSLTVGFRNNPCETSFRQLLFINLAKHNIFPNQTSVLGIPKKNQ